MRTFKVLLYAASALFLSAYGDEFPSQLRQPFLYKMMKEIDTLPADNFTAKPVRVTDVGAKVTPEEDSLMRRMIKHSAATYCSDGALRLWTCKHCRALERVELVAVADDLLTGGKAYVAVDHALKTIVVAFRGSSNIRNWVMDFNIGMVDLDVGDGTKGIRVHQGFLQYSNAIGAKIIPTVRTLVSKHKNYTITITGHSLGGAVSSLSSLMLKRQLNIPWSSIKLVTFGQPRVGNEAFANWMNRQASTHLRVVNNRDKVPHVPPYTMGYAHHHREIFLVGKTIKSCTSLELEDATCSNSRVPLLSTLDHINYLDVNFTFLC
ncbi:hypothetical protein DSO57_1033499 [Entomophthora muscae]|uniref:Uncharacterized protein n=1 Tax=Entomophthora muscae TaxID=34485 RepID=A0ACC2SD61_9FUNG|nr:hypothetical protein DSO57_1033499 [Entomophthora muscae]